MSKDYEERLSALRHAIKSEGAIPSVIDANVNALLEIGSVNLPGDLLLLLSDGAEFDEGMFTLIHAAESSDDSTYVHALLSVFCDLVESAPRWASIVVMRVLNNDSARHEMVSQLRGASTETKEAFRLMCERINSVSPQFLSKTTSVSLAATV